MLQILPRIDAVFFLKRLSTTWLNAISSFTSQYSIMKKGINMIQDLWVGMGYSFLQF